MAHSRLKAAGGSLALKIASTRRSSICTKRSRPVLVGLRGSQTGGGGLGLAFRNGTWNSSPVVMTASAPRRNTSASERIGARRGGLESVRAVVAWSNLRLLQTADELVLRGGLSFQGGGDQGGHATLRFFGGVAFDDTMMAAILASFSMGGFLGSLPALIASASKSAAARSCSAFSSAVFGIGDTHLRERMCPAHYRRIRTITAPRISTVLAPTIRSAMGVR